MSRRSSRRSPRALDGQWPFEVVYVNDGSTDGTEAELQRLKAQYPWLREPAAQAVLRAVGGGAHRRCAPRARRWS